MVLSVLKMGVCGGRKDGALLEKIFRKEKIKGCFIFGKIFFVRTKVFSCFLAYLFVCQIFVQNANVNFLEIFKKEYKQMEKVLHLSKRNDRYFSPFRGRLFSRQVKVGNCYSKTKTINKFRKRSVENPISRRASKNYLCDEKLDRGGGRAFGKKENVSVRGGFGRSPEVLRRR